MVLYRYSPLRTTESLTRQRSSPNRSTESSAAAQPVKKNTVLRSRTEREIESSSTPDNHNQQEASDAAGVALRRDVETGVDIDNEEFFGLETLDYDRIIAAIVSSHGHQRKKDTQRSLGQRNVRSVAKCMPIIRESRKGEIVDLDEDPPYQQLQNIDDVNCHAQHIQSSGCFPPIDSHLASLSTESGLDNYSGDTVADILESGTFSDPRDISMLSRLCQSFALEDESNPFLQLYIDPCNIDTDPGPTPTPQSLGSDITPETKQEFMASPFEDTTKTWMHLDEFVDIQSLRSRDGVAGLLYIDDVFSELLE
ncbi:hypothetical protein V1509DRAFT_560044 [Lipomyces kononenkoae]